MKTLESQRLLLRGFELSDLKDVFDYAKDPEVGPNAGWPPHESIQHTRDILDRFILGDNVWALIEKASGRVVGSLGLHKDEKRDNAKIRMIGYALGRAWWGRGYMTEAVKRVLAHLFEEEGLMMVTVYHYSFNQRSRRVIEKCGFQCEGTLRMASTLYDGRVLDDVCYSLTREEYFGGAEQDEK